MSVAKLNYVLICLDDQCFMCTIVQAYAPPPPNYFVRLDNRTSKDDLYLRRRSSMRRWLCCSCHAEEPNHLENEHHKNQSYGDGRSLQVSFFSCSNFLTGTLNWESLRVSLETAGLCH